MSWNVLHTRCMREALKNIATGVQVSFVDIRKSEGKTTSIGNISSIITPWNTGNERNNSGASSIG
jgi:hypothetical protein